MNSLILHYVANEYREVLYGPLPTKQAAEDSAASEEGRFYAAIEVPVLSMTVQK